MDSKIRACPEPSAPRVSVTMPARNTACWIGAAIQSVLDQDLTDFEMLIVDDGSTDGTPQIARQFVELDRRIRFYPLKRTGLADVRNFAVLRARGEYVAVMDSDDLAARERFTKQVAFLDTNPGVLAVSSSMAVISNQLTVPRRLDGLKIRTAEGRSSSRLGRFNLGRVRAFHGPAMIRRDAILRAGLYRPFFSTAEDTDLFLRLEELGEIRSLPDVLYFQRRHRANTNLNLNYTLAECATLAEILARRRRRGKPDCADRPMPRFLALFRLGLAPPEIGHALALIAVRYAKRLLTTPRRRRSANLVHSLAAFPPITYRS